MTNPSMPPRTHRRRHARNRLLTGMLVSLMGVASLQAQTKVNIRLTEASDGEITPAMVCITGTSEGEVRLPPDGRVLEKPGTVHQFYEGIEYEEDRNWIGPVRKTAGKSDNDDRAVVYEMRPSIPYWSEPVMFQVSGDFTIDLPKGTWRLAVEHGVEYVPVVEEFTTDGTGEMTRTIPLERWIDMNARGWWSGDVHVHHPILKEAHKEYLLSYAEAVDLNIVNVLEMGDHKTTHFRQMSFGKKARVKRGTTCLVAGQEEPRSNFGHIIGLNLEQLERVEDLKDYDFYDIIFKRIQAQDEALVGFAHFAWNGCALPRGFPWYVTTGDLDFVELMQFGLVNEMDYYEYLNLGFRLTAAAGSDIPWGSHMGEVRTYVHTGKAFDVDAWFDHLRKGHSFVSNGPMLTFTVDGELPGAELIRKPGETVTIKAQVESHAKIGTPKALTLVSNEGEITEVLNPGKADALAFEVKRKIDRSQWLVVSAVCDNGTLAHATPVYVVVDGVPTWCPQRGPAVIDKQLQGIARIAGEVPNSGYHGSGIHERLERARKFYAELREKMAATQ